MKSNVFIPFYPCLSASSMQAYIDAKVSEELLNESLDRLFNEIKSWPEYIEQTKSVNDGISKSL